MDKLRQTQSVDSVIYFKNVKSYLYIYENVKQLSSFVQGRYTSAVNYSIVYCTD